MNKKYRYIWSEKRSLINVESHLLQYVKERDIFGSTHEHSFVFSKDGLAEEQHLDIDNKKWIKSGRKLLKKDFFVKIINQGKKQRKQFENFLFKIRNTNFKTMTDEKLIGLFNQSVQFYSRLRAYFKITRPEFLLEAENTLKKLLKPYFKDQNLLQKNFEILTTPHSFDKVNQELIDWVKLLSESTPEATTLITHHLQQYPWLVAQTHNEKNILTQFTKKFRVDKKNIKEKQKEIIELIKNKKKLQKTQWLLEEEFNNPKINYLSWLFREASLERMRLKGGWAGADYLYLPIYREIFKRTNISLSNICSFYRISEIIKAIKQRKPIIRKEELEKRSKFYILILKNSKISFISGKEAGLIIEKELHQETSEENNKILKGRIASQGHIKGKARIVIPGNIVELNKAFHLFKKGEILVTPMTQPNMVPIMKKAAAVVTDEGGLTSHAAILAREFGIPCIVGTEIATKIIKNGDIIEVDANIGIIKILNKKTP